METGWLYLVPKAMLDEFIKGQKRVAELAVSNAVGYAEFYSRSHDAVIRTRLTKLTHRTPATKSTDPHQVADRELRNLAPRLYPPRAAFGLSRLDAYQINGS
jgi:hypothetical protein